MRFSIATALAAILASQVAAASCPYAERAATIAPRDTLASPSGPIAGKQGIFYSTSVYLLPSWWTKH